VLTSDSAYKTFRTLARFAGYLAGLVSPPTTAGELAPAHLDGWWLPRRRHAGGPIQLGELKTTLRKVAGTLLQIYPGRAMTCVFDQTKALCQLRRSEGDIRATPDQDDCQPACRNLAYTDRDIATLRHQATQLEALLGDFLAPSPRYQRARVELDRIHTLIHKHRRRP
jgi:hypothetical protein